MVFAVNAKPACYTGFWQLIQPGRRFKYVDFLAEQALPGPGSIITCILQPQGSTGAVEFLTIEKKTALSQIPGLKYRPEVLANLPKPASWDNHKLSESAKQSIIVRALSTAIFDPSIQESTSEVLRYLDARLHL